jgi:hypothetical protein
MPYGCFLGAIFGAILGATLALAAGLGETGRSILRIDDPSGDDHGPGCYLYPSNSHLYRRGSFDLERFEVRLADDHVVFLVTLGTPIRRPTQPPRVTHARAIDLDNEIYIQNIDIYIDRDPAPGEGFTEAVPGRNVRIDPEGAWDTAVVITPQPYRTRSLLRDWRPVGRVHFATDVTANGPEVRVRVPLSALGGEPQPSWGYSVLVTGARWEASFDLVNRYLRGSGLNAFTMPVHTLPESEAFGGGELSAYNPNVIDMLVPPNQSQAEILRVPDPNERHLATVPMLYPDPQAFLAARKTAAPIATAPTEGKAPGEPLGPGFVARIADIQGETIVLDLLDKTVKKHRIGEVLDSMGTPVAQVVVASVFPGFVVARAIEGRDNIRVGAFVRFTEPENGTRRMP